MPEDLAFQPPQMQSKTLYMMVDDLPSQKLKMTFEHVDSTELQNMEIIYEGD